MNPPVFRVSEWPMAHFARIERQHQANANVLLKPHGLKHTEWRILALTDELGQASLTQIVEQVVIERTTIGKLIDRMVAVGWLEKGKSSTDARTMQVSLSPAGQQVLQATAPAMRALMKQYASALSASEYQQLMSSVRAYGEKVRQGLNAPPDPPT